jgi:hypothetical protein
MHGAYVRCSRRSFARALAYLHQHAWAVCGHEYGPDGGGESLLGHLGRDTDEAARGADHEPACSAPWMYPPLEMLRLCADAAAHGAIQTFFRTLQLYGATLSPGTWDECLWKVTFPLLDTLSPRRRNALTPPSSPDAAAHTDDVDTLASDSSLSSSSGESKLVALQSIGAITSDLLMWKIMDLPKHNASWPPFKSSNGSASASTPTTSGPLPPPLANNNISIGTTGAGTTALHAHHDFHPARHILHSRCHS